MSAPGPTSRYELLLAIARGGMATVYAGRVRGASGFSRLVAIKRPHASVTSDRALERQLEQEAHVASMIHHTNVVSVLDVERIDGELLLVMDYVEGCSLKDLLAVDAVPGLSAPVAVRILLDVAAGLHAAHRLQDADGEHLALVHRDVSPHNILIGIDGVARLADFGIAKVANVPREETTENVLKGKLAYLPPEYIEARAFDARSDLYALAVVAWEALTGRRLFQGASAAETLHRIVAQRPPRLGGIRPELTGMEAVVDAALAPRPDDRPASVEAFARELEASARAMGCVATHAEVGALVERVAGPKLVERRRALEHVPSRPLHEVEALGAKPARERDGMETASLQAPAGAAPSPAASVPTPSPPAPQAGPPVNGAPPSSRSSARGRWLLGGLLVIPFAAALVFQQTRRERLSAAETHAPQATASAPAQREAPREASAAAMATATPVDPPPAKPIRRTRARPHRPAAAASSVRLPTRAPPNPYDP